MKRYIFDVELHRPNGGTIMAASPNPVEHEEGDWIRYSDHEVEHNCLRQERDEARKRALKQCLDIVNRAWCVDDICSQIVSLLVKEEE